MFNVDDILKATEGTLLKGTKDTKIKGVSIDSRTIKDGDLFIAIKGDNFDGHDFIDEAIKKGASAIVAEKFFLAQRNLNHLPLIKVKDSVKALGRIANYHRRRFDIPVIAVTGSNGKTTTKDMIAWILKERFNVLKNLGTKNNAIGVPLTLLGLNSGHNLCVLEIGTNHFGEVQYLTQITQPSIGVVLNIGPSHLEFLKDLAGVYKEKSSLISGLVHPKIGFVNTDDTYLKNCRRMFKDRLIFGFGIKDKAEFFASEIKLCARHLEFKINKGHKVILNTCGYHNVYNALAAIGIARLFGLDYKIIASQLKKFDFPQGRLKFIRVNNVNFIDDTYNSNPLSLEGALGALENLRVKGRKIFIMGDMLELGKNKEEFHRQAAHRISKICDCFISVGDLAALTAKVIKDKDLHYNGVFRCSCAGEAKHLLNNYIKPNKDDIVLVKGSRRLLLEEILK
ncbi:MAG: UDP-N-acetylmuramoyl-tripeptide--D-alanyl-D-alanine ligase [Candidatus Omnitrophica bacterium]|nr:UDP-N-acetylmuramoyl-tripeptide--D-alanyl-D-alanine ligase [Candidatus Omnitrophota bacterium]